MSDDPPEWPQRSLRPVGPASGDEGGRRRNEQTPGPVALFNLNSFRRMLVALAAIRAVILRDDFDDAKKIEIIKQYMAASIGPGEAER